jgi:hypothetical protein
VLIGNDVAFAGTLAGATLEWFWSDRWQSLSPEYTGSVVFQFGANQSAWWTWTPTESTTVTLQVLDCSKSTYNKDGVLIYAGTNIVDVQPIAHLAIDSLMPHRFLTFSAQAATNYQIQLVGTNAASFNLRLIATNFPVILESPASQTVTVDDSVLFTAVAAGLKPLGYQWRFNGTDLPGETAAMLALDHVTTSQTGPYSVAVTNAAGETVSDMATLSVTSADTVPIMAGNGLQAGQFQFTLTGEIGRRYRIESSTNLAAWIPEADFSSMTFHDAYQSTNAYRSVILEMTGADTFLVPARTQSKFVRTEPFHAVNEPCNNNIKQIRFAQLLWAWDHQYDRNQTVTGANLMPYLKNGEFPQCPVYGPYLSYGITTVIANPYCFTGIHPFEER